MAIIYVSKLFGDTETIFHEILNQHLKVSVRPGIDIVILKSRVTKTRNLRRMENYFLHDPTNNKARMCSTINLRRVITSHQHLHTAEAKHIGTGTNIKSASFRRYHQSLSKVLLLTARSIIAVNSI